jgi:hypothetical protein
MHGVAGDLEHLAQVLDPDAVRPAGAPGLDFGGRITPGDHVGSVLAEIVADPAVGVPLFSKHAFHARALVRG